MHTTLFAMSWIIATRCKVNYLWNCFAHISRHLLNLKFLSFHGNQEIQDFPWNQQKSTTTTTTKTLVKIKWWLPLGASSHYCQEGKVPAAGVAWRATDKMPAFPSSLFPSQDISTNQHRETGPLCLSVPRGGATVKWPQNKNFRSWSTCENWYVPHNLGRPLHITDEKHFGSNFRC